MFSAEWLIEPTINVRGEYNDNIFLTSLPHEGVYALKIIPSVDAIVREAEWQLALNARISNNNYSDNTLDINDEYYTLTGSYRGERNIFSLSANYIFDSNLTSVSSDFGVFGRRVDREIRSISPSYTRLLSERSTMVLSYSFSETDYRDNAALNFIPYEIQTLSASYLYDLTEKDRLSISLQLSDYQSDDKRTEYLLLTSRLGIEHDFSETLTADASVGNSRQRVTNRFFTTIPFPGNPVVITQENESTNRGLVFDIGIEKTFDTSSVSGRASRRDSTDSLGNLNKVESISAAYQHSLSDYWSYNTRAKYEDIVALSSAVGRNPSVDRELLSFNVALSYRLTQFWRANFSYRYLLRRFRSDTSNDRAPHSNLISAEISYNFPPLTTF